MEKFIPLAFIGIGVFAVVIINPLPPYNGIDDILTRVLGSLVCAVLFIGAGIASFMKKDS